MIEVIEHISTPLPMDMERRNTCMFTGHRRIDYGTRKRLAYQLDSYIGELCRVGYRYFVCGGALGFDTLAAEAVVRAAERGLRAELILALPCLDQTADWLRDSVYGIENVKKYQMLKGLATSLRYTSEFMNPTCMKLRNQYMVDISSLCVAYYVYSNPRSGTGMTVRMADRAGIPVKLI